MARFSANLGFLFTDRPLPDAVRAAKAAGFEAVELHWPYETPAADLRAALDETGLPLLSLNTAKGGEGEFGLCALPGREPEARAAIDQALSYAAEAGAGAVHAMAGKATGQAARETLLKNLAYAADAAAAQNATILIEPLNPFDAPGFHYVTSQDALDVLDALDRPNVKLLFDVYHRQRVEGDLLGRFKAQARRIGHVQIAAAPDRGEPDQGEIDYGWLIPQIEAAGYEGFIGAEYKPRSSVEAGLGWLARFK